MDEIKYNLLQDRLNTYLSELEREPFIPLMQIGNKWIPVCGEAMASEIYHLYHTGIRIQIIKIKKEMEALYA